MTYTKPVKHQNVTKLENKVDYQLTQVLFQQLVETKTELQQWIFDLHLPETWQVIANFA